MPRISKIRIVNFNYNEGKRLIADELYNFSSADHEKGLNCLINLANGGGKSVLVQLMLQPMIPKARVAGRKISSFFDKPTDHFYVVIEWIKDNSTEKLITGISMRLMGTKNNEENSGRGKEVTYYTFYGNYSDDSCSYSIANLPLSAKENGRFVPADFNDIRKFAKSTAGKLNCFSDSEKGNWKEKLAEYGISQSEWHMIEDLNSVEGGLAEYFGDFKSSDQLVDKLFIETIEKKTGKAQSEEDNSLVTMILNYAEDYSRQEEKIRKRESASRFTASMTELQPQIEDLSQWNDTTEKDLGLLFGYMDALTRLKNSSVTERDNRENRISDMKQQCQSIRYEKASAEYYGKKEMLEEAVSRDEKILEEKNRTETEKDEAEFNNAQLECAGFRDQIQRDSSRIEALKASIREIENNSEDGKRLEILKYSTRCAAEKEIELQDQEISKEETVLYDLNTEIEQKKTESETLQKQEKEKTEDWNRKQGRLDEQSRYSDQLVKELKLPLSRGLDGCYRKEELESLLKEKQNEKNRLQSSVTRLTEKKEKIEEQLKQYPEETGKLVTLSVNLENERKQLQKEKEEYDRQAEKIQAVCKLYQLPFESVFTCELEQTLKTEKEANRFKSYENNRQIRINEEQCKSVQSGTLHLSGEAVEYLDSIQADYESCEKYLLNQTGNGNMTQEGLTRILELCPALAYGILLNENSKKELLSMERGEWLCSAIPVFTYEDLNQLMEGKPLNSDWLAFYEQEYFKDPQTYLSKLQTREKELAEKKEHLLLQEEELQQQINLCTVFDYDESWLKEQNRKTEANEEEIRKVNQKICLLQQKQKELEEQNRETGLKIRQQEEQLQQSTEQERKLAELIRRSEAETELYDEICRLQQEAGKLAVRNRELKKELDLQTREQNRIQEDLKELRNRKEELTAIFEKVRDCHPSDRISGSARELMLQYEELQRIQGSKIEDLNSQLNDRIATRKEAENKLATYRLKEEDYAQTVYSLEKLNEVRERLRQLNEDLKEWNEKARKSTGERYRCQTLFDTAVKQLEKFGCEPMEKSKIGADFDQRIRNLETAITETGHQIDELNARIKSLERAYERGTVRLEGEVRPEETGTVELEDDLTAQFSRLWNQWKQDRDQTMEKKKTVQAFCRNMQVQFTEPEMVTAITTIRKQLEPENRSADYITVSICIDQAVRLSELFISQINTDLKEIDNFRKDLVRQCLNKAATVYEALGRIQSSSSVVVYEGKDRKQMVRFTIPEGVTRDMAEPVISDELRKGTDELLRKMKETDISRVELEKLARRIVGSPNLLRKYINQENITVKAFKIDQNSQNAGYRTWEQTQINNSGAEKFVVYFALILSLMNYTRSNPMVNEKKCYSALILDNPFGATSSRHILQPMFMIARHFRVQMICLSDINKAEVINCFDIVIKAVIRKRPLSSNELLTHEENELIEHGFYRSEQMSLV